MSVALHPYTIGNAREVTSKTCHCNDKQFVTSFLEQCALAGPTVMSVALNLYPCVRVGQVKVRDINDIRC